MKLTLGSISTRKSGGKSGAAETLLQEFVARANRFCPTESGLFPDESSLLAFAARQPGRPAASLILFDSRGELLTSAGFAESLGRLRDGGAQRLLLGIGPASGWSPAARSQATRILSFGRITLPHELARVVLAEQVYRALTILAGHPYHCGH